MALQLHRDYMQVVDTEFLGFLKGEFPDQAEKLLCYFFPLTQTFVIAEWVCEDAGEIIEISSYEAAKGPDEFTVKDVRFWYSVLRQKWRSKLALAHKIQRGINHRKWAEQVAKDKERHERLVHSVPDRNRDYPGVCLGVKKKLIIPT